MAYRTHGKPFFIEVFGLKSKRHSEARSCPQLLRTVANFFEKTVIQIAGDCFISFAMMNKK